MSNIQFSEGTKHLLRRHPALPAAQTRELGAAFAQAQTSVCNALGALGYPLERVAQELKAGSLPFFREGSDQDRKRNSGKKSSYRFAGFAPSHLGEIDTHFSDRDQGKVSSADVALWQATYLMGFTFEVIEQVALRALPAPSEASSKVPAALARQQRSELSSALEAARKLRDQILTGNLLLVANIVFKRGRFYPTMVMDDLFTAGTDGLGIAVSRYDPSVGQFSTYATPWIKMAIDRFVAKTRNVIRIPIGLQDKARRERSAEGDSGKGEASALIPQVQSLEEAVPGFTDTELRLEDVVADPLSAQPNEAVEQSDIARILGERLRQLDPLKQFVIAMRNDIGDAAGLAARLFREEAALSLARGRATAAAAAKSLDEPARIRVIGSTEVARAEPEVTLETEDLALAG